MMPYSHERLYRNIFEFTIVCYRCMDTQFWMLMTLFSFHPFALEYLNPQKLDNGWTWKVGVPSFWINFLLPIHPRNRANLLEFICYSFTLSSISPCLPHRPSSINSFKSFNFFNRVARTSLSSYIVFLKVLNPCQYSWSFFIYCPIAFPFIHMVLFP